MSKRTAQEEFEELARLWAELRDAVLAEAARHVWLLVAVAFLGAAALALMALGWPEMFHGEINPRLRKDAP